MNKYDSELIAGILKDNGYDITDNINRADAVLINTCAVREHAENRALSNISQLRALKKKKSNIVIGVLGCMSKNLSDSIMEKNPHVNLVLGPDSYQLLPELLKNGDGCVDVAGREQEHYDGYFPLRNRGISAWVAISRGCNEACSYCIVPYTRGKERSRPVKRILEEIKQLLGEGFQEVTLLGQNVNSYEYEGIDFPKLLENVSGIEGLRRIRFATSHPMNLSDKLIDVISERENVCAYLHLPVQSGSNRILEVMKRNYSAEKYLSLIEKAKSKIKDLSLTSDFISGFPGETDDDHKCTIELVKKAEFDGGFTFKYSPRDKTEAYTFGDDVPEQVKIERLTEISELLRETALKKNKKWVGRTAEIMIEGKTRRSDIEVYGRTDGFKKVVLKRNNLSSGMFTRVSITDATSQTLLGCEISE